MSIRLKYIDSAQLNALFHQEKPFVIAYLRNHCPDSRFLYDNFLSSYIACYPQEAILYVFEFEANRLYDLETMSYPLAYWRFLDDYGLSMRNNPKFGFERGHIPTFQFIIPNGQVPKDDGTVIIDMCVVYNDARTETDEKQIRIGKSYFDGSRPLAYTNINLKGRELPAWRRVEIGVYHDELLRSFLDQYLPKTIALID